MEFPDRTFDVGIAEQHAVTSAAGLAFGGMHPVVAVYATFLNRAFDQVLMDCALHKAGVTFVLDRAGVTGDDGASHNGMWDLSMLQVVPGLRIAAPRDESTLRRALREAVDVADAPTVVRFPKGALEPEIPAIRTADGIDVLAETGAGQVLIVAVGSFAGMGIEISERLVAQGMGAVVVSPLWVKPVPEALVALARSARLVAVLEDGVRVGGVGAAITLALQDAEVSTPIRSFGIPAAFLDHAKRPQILADLGLTAQEISRRLVEIIAGQELMTPETPSPSSALDEGISAETN
jgi:1-deoxy-D-xylulose-5-phosphate synthase